MPDQDERAVAFRALALTALLTRTQLEHGVKADRQRMAGWQRIHDELAGWMAKEGIDAAVSPSERALLERPLGSWSDDEIFECVWRSEALAALLWALGMVDPMPDGRPARRGGGDQPAHSRAAAGRPVAGVCPPAPGRGAARRPRDGRVLAVAGADRDDAPPGHKAAAGRNLRSERSPARSSTPCAKTSSSGPVRATWTSTARRSQSWSRPSSPTPTPCRWSGCLR